jgi:hypothetical protein
VNAYDQGSGFSYGIYRGAISIDGAEIFAFARDSLNYVTGSQINYVNDNELQSLIGDQNGSSDDDRKTFYRLYCQPNDIQAFYGTYSYPDGIIDSDRLDSNPHKIQISLFDINGNSSKIRLYIRKATLAKPEFHRFTKNPKATNILIDTLPDGIRFETQICHKNGLGFQAIDCRLDKIKNMLNLPPLGPCKNIRIRTRNQAGEFSPWVSIDPDLKKSRIQQYSDYWGLVNVQNGLEQPFIDLFTNIIDKNNIDNDTWQGVADIQNWSTAIYSTLPDNKTNLNTYFCDSSMNLHSPDSLITLSINEKILYGRTIVNISAMYGRNEIPNSFEIGPDQLLFNGSAQLRINTEKLSSDQSKTSLYIKGGGKWYYKAGIVNAQANCPISGAGEFAFLSDDKPATISGLIPKNGSALRDSKPIISCKVGDNLSGISRESQFAMYIDNNWVPADYDITTGIFSYQVNQPLKKGKHEAMIKIIDNQGNLATAVTKFAILGKY